MAKDLLGVSIYSLDLSMRSRKCLQRLGVMTVRDLTDMTEGELQEIKNFGETSLQEIRKVLADCGGLMIGQNVPDKRLPENARVSLRNLNILTLRQISQLTYLSLVMIVGGKYEAEIVKNVLLSRGFTLADGEPIDLAKEDVLDPKTTFWQVAHTMSSRLRNVLLRCGGWSPEMTLKEISSWTPAELSSIKGLAETGIMELKVLLQKANLKLAVPKPPKLVAPKPVEPPPEIRIACSTLIQDLFDYGMISARAKNVLKRLGVTTLGQATQLPKDVICSCKNAGDVTCAEIDDLLKRGGMRYCDSREERQLKQPVSVLRLSVRAHNCLEAGKIETLGDLVGKTGEELQRFRSLGQTCLWEIKQKLEEKGLSLQPSDSDSDLETKSNVLYDTRFEPDNVLTRRVETTIGPVGEPKLDIGVEVQGGTLVITPFEQNPITLEYKNRQVILNVADCLAINIGEAHKLAEPSFKPSRWRKR